VTPFWHRFQGAGPRAVVLNVPNAFMQRPFNGVEVFSLASDHTLLPMSSTPAGIAEQLSREFGRHPFSEEGYGLMTLKEFLAVRDEMIGVAEWSGDLYLKMMRDETWDVFLAVFAVLHRAGHRLWSLTNVVDIKTGAEREQASDALRQVYIACDRALGRLVDASGPDAVQMLFSFHGMHANHSREWILPEMLRRVLADSDGARTDARPSLLQAARDLVPPSWRTRVKEALPPRYRQRLTLFWRLGQVDWSKTRAFVIPLEVQVGIRINLKGREAQGIVQPGAEYESLCRTIREGLSDFVDSETRVPLITDVYPARDVFSGGRTDWLPDLLATWNDEPSARHRLITSTRYGDIPWPTPGHNPEGRSGNHTAEGFLIAHGAGVRRGEIRDAHILDLAPTLYSLLGLPAPAGMEGKVLPLMTE
jgi:predicted AlkP superfamily phosphohydrolase/phosphomutase